MLKFSRSETGICLLVSNGKMIPDEMIRLGTKKVDKVELRTEEDDVDLVDSEASSDLAVHV